VGAEMKKSDDLLTQFTLLCREVSTLETSYSQNIEDGYERMLNFLIKNSVNRASLSSEMISIVRKYRDARRGGDILLSVDAMAYCMHELRWREVLETANDEHRSYFLPRADSTLRRLIDSFSDDWSEASDYRRFAKN
jgi:hypothetical protein